MKVLPVIAVCFAILQFATAASMYYADSDRPNKRSALLQPEGSPDWNQLGWAWGKRSAGVEQIPRRLVRALHPVKKNPDWQDLGFAWGRK